MKGMEIKVYLVLQRVDAPEENAPNEEVLDVCLTKSKAVEASQGLPGTRIKKMFAKK